MHKILRRDLLNIMEKQVLIQLAFDLTNNNPEHFIDRYLRILHYQKEKQVKKISIQIVTLHFIDE